MAVAAVVVVAGAEVVGEPVTGGLLEPCAYTSGMKILTNMIFRLGMAWRIFILKNFSSIHTFYLTIGIHATRMILYHPCRTH